MAEIAWKIQIVSGPSKKQVVVLTASVPDGTLANSYQMDPAGAISLGEILTKAGTQAKTGLVAPNGMPVQPS
jgi:hypothetical protein